MSHRSRLRSAPVALFLVNLFLVNLLDMRCVAQVKVALRASGRNMVRSCGPATQITKRLFPRSFDRTHISKWLIAHHSGMSLEELDVLVGKNKNSGYIIYIYIYMNKYIAH